MLSSSEPIRDVMLMIWRHRAQVGQKRARDVQCPERVYFELLQEAGEVHVVERLDVKDSRVVDEQVDVLVAECAGHGSGPSAHR